MLPGNIYADPTVTRYHKTQLLGIKDNTICGKLTKSCPIKLLNPFFCAIEQTRALKEPIDAALLESMRLGASTNFSGVPSRPKHENDAIPKIAPKWLKHDRQVLRFDTYFQEPVVESRDENFRVHKCTMLYYLEDDTIHILEDRQENAGLPQGVFLKRHKVPADGRTAKAYHWSDFQLPMDLKIYERIFRVYNCDAFTREFYTTEGYSLGSAEALPEDPYKAARAMINYKQNPPDTAECKNYNEVKLGGGRYNSNLHSFLENDRKVLSFSIYW